MMQNQINTRMYHHTHRWFSFKKICGGIFCLFLVSIFYETDLFAQEKAFDFQNRLCKVSRQTHFSKDTKEEYMLLFVGCKDKVDAFSTWQCKKTKDKENVDMFQCEEQKTHARVHVYSSERDLPGGVCSSACR